MSAICAHLRLAGLALVSIVMLAAASAPVRAQSLVATVNDSPITSYDLDQRMRLLRVLRMPATPATALESLIEDRIKAQEIRKYGIAPTVQDATQEMGRIASERKIPPQTLGAALQSAKVDAPHWQEHGKAQIGWRGYVSALNKGVGVSESEVRTELDKRGAAKAQEYNLRPIVFVLPRTASAAEADARGREAANLRARFNDCASGVQFAQALRDVAVRQPITRTPTSLPEALAATIEKTPVGKLTPPQRTADGIEMLAVCSKGRAGTDGSAAQEVRQELLAKKLEGVAEKLYEPLRKRAIIVKR